MSKPSGEERLAAEAADDTIPGDRGRSPIADRVRPPWLRRIVPIAGLGLGAAIFLGLSWHTPRKVKTEPQKPAEQIVTFDPAGAARSHRPTLADPGPNPPRLEPDEVLVPALDPSLPAGVEGSSDRSRAPLPTAEKASRLIVFSRKEGLQGGAPAPPSPISVGVEGTRPRTTELEALRQGSALSVLRAERLPDRNFLILAGALLPCVLMTAIDSSTPGHVACLLTRDVYSDNGAVILLEKGSRVLGEYRGGLRRGQRRIFIVWTRAVTPNGVAVPLGSPASDALGRGGFDGEVDTHFWARFGGGLMFSLVDDGASLAWDRDQSGTISIPSDAATAALKEASDVSPTLRKAQGAEVAIFVAHDLDFSKVYGLEARR